MSLYDLSCSKYCMNNNIVLIVQLNYFRIFLYDFIWTHWTSKMFILTYNNLNMWYDSKCKYLFVYSRLNWHWHISLSARWWAINGRQFSMDITIQFVIYIEIALIFQIWTTCGTLKTVNMKILILNANKYTTGRWKHS